MMQVHQLRIRRLACSYAARTGRRPAWWVPPEPHDPDLSRGLPPATSVTSGVNALAHAVEALYAPDTSSLIRMLAVEGMRALIAALPAIVRTPDDPAARARALYAAWLCGTCLGATTMSLHHKLCHTLGGTFNLPHAETHTVVLPYVLAYNAQAAPAALAAVAEALAAADAAQALWEFTGALGAPRSLRELGLTDADTRHHRRGHHRIGAHQAGQSGAAGHPTGTDRLGGGGLPGRGDDLPRARARRPATAQRRPGALPAGARRHPRRRAGHDRAAVHRRSGPPCALHLESHNPDTCLRPRGGPRTAVHSGVQDACSTDRVTASDGVDRVNDQPEHR
jgi:hypothetical protein